ncbi:hypothetical protein JCM33774_37190 [Actinophytocola sp. KF-1]
MPLAMLPVPKIPIRIRPPSVRKDGGSADAYRSVSDMEFLADCRARMALDLLATRGTGWCCGRCGTGPSGCPASSKRWAQHHGDAVMAAQGRVP